MATNNKISVSELDFDAIKSNLKEYLKGQDKFSDYDFEGSGLSVLLDVLAYNTHYNALYTNLAVNEAFLDSASKRNSVVSIAKALGYVPDSAHGATAFITMVVSNTTSTPAVINLPKYTQFTTVVDSVTYNFYTMEEYVAVLNSENNTYSFNSIAIKEGTPLLFKYEVMPGQRYILSNDNIDVDTIRVRIQDNATSSTFTTYTRNENLLELNELSKVFFLKEIEGEYYELEFGNDVIGKALQNGNIVNIEYMTCNKDLPNGARTFSYQGSSLLGGTISNPITLIAAQNGVDKEGIDTIRYNAPRAYSAQNRAVTVNDYKNIILSQFSEAESVNVWGGEDNIPPTYGKVFLSIKPKSTNALSESQKSNIIETILKPRNVVSITPVIVDPEYIDIEIDTSVYYNPKTTNKAENDIKSLVLSAINSYANNYLDSFDGVFRFSKFSAEIDAAEPSIISNITTLKLHRGVEPKYNIFAQYNIELGNPIYGSGLPEQSILTTGFFVPDYNFAVYMEDFPTNTTNGQLRMFYYDDQLNKQYLKTLGSVDYAKGSIVISNLNIIGIDSSVFEFIIKPQSNDVISIRNQLVRIPQEKVNINILVDKVASGDAAGNANYVFTSSRN